MVCVNGWTIFDVPFFFNSTRDGPLEGYSDGRGQSQSMVAITVKKANWCPRQVSQFLLSWVCPARCTAILVGSITILSVYVPYSWYDEEGYITALEVVSIIMEEGKAMGPRTSSLAAISTSSSSLRVGANILRGLDSC